MMDPETSLTVQWLGLHVSNAGGVGSVPGWRTKSPHAAGHSQNIYLKKSRILFYIVLSNLPFPT